MFLQRNKTALVLGVANQRSLAWSCALSLLRGEFNHVIVTYQNDRFQKSVKGLVQNYNDEQSTGDSVHSTNKLLSCLSCDISEESQVEELFGEKIPLLLLRNKGPTGVSSSSSNSSLPERDLVSAPVKLDALVHCIAFAPSKAMKDSTVDLPLLNTDVKDFATAHCISAHSLLTVSRYALPLLSSSLCHTIHHDGGEEKEEVGPLSCSSNTTKTSIGSSSITALTYLGSTRAVRNYNVMGPAKASLEACVRGLAMELSPPPHCIRVNAISAGPVNTLAARGIRNFNDMRHQVQERSFLKRHVTGEEVGNAVEFVAGSRASGITGQVIFCDGGYSSWGG